MSSISETLTPPHTQDSAAKPVKCVVWDLDDTIWHGTLLEDAEVVLRPGVVAVLRALDERGILNSIASRNEADMARNRLRAAGIDEYFVHPQIGWGAKSASIRAIAEGLNIGRDTLLFVDDQRVERDEVAFQHPEVRTVDAADIKELCERPDLNPPFVTSDAKMRRRLYQAESERQADEQRFEGPSDEFLASLNLELTIYRTRDEDLRRAEELTVRTNQLNTTGISYSYDELEAVRLSPNHALLIADLHDRYGGYGKIGLVLIEQKQSDWTIKLLLMSCRVMSRGVGRILVSEIVRRSQQAGVNLFADFIATPRNRMMYVAYKFAGFSEVSSAADGTILFQHDGSDPGQAPSYVSLTSDW
ncbi:HAD-IIIC family phosphatase [Bradyrhizobium prioriisuperbiae]|uniref:HAD-IIIC family phosphatase n=1 Tax=Bradyrhizobium prioriisuperbiae TaxID=2854389 RepID=UPI0028ECE4A8|nr:HAD-IIIC family phosphatase [Bradyrhizobium prioritasuperba]